MAKTTFKTPMSSFKFNSSLEAWLILVNLLIHSIMRFVGINTLAQSVMDHSHTKVWFARMPKRPQPWQLLSKISCIFSQPRAPQASRMSLRPPRGRGTNSLSLTQDCQLLSDRILSIELLLIHASRE